MIAITVTLSRLPITFMHSSYLAQATHFAGSHLQVLDSRLLIRKLYRTTIASRQPLNMICDQDSCGSFIYPSCVETV